MPHMDPRHWNQTCIQSFLSVPCRMCLKQMYLQRGQIQASFLVSLFRVESSRASGLTGAEIEVPGLLKHLRMCTPGHVHLSYKLPRVSQDPSNKVSQSLEISLAPPECFELFPPENKWTLLKLNRKSVLPVSSCMGNLPKACSPEPHHSLPFMQKNHTLVGTL